LLTEALIFALSALNQLMMNWTGLLSILNYNGTKGSAKAKTETPAGCARIIVQRFDVERCQNR
jgi:hypothetical protein